MQLQFCGKFNTVLSVALVYNQSNNKSCHHNILKDQELADERTGKNRK